MLDQELNVCPHVCVLCNLGARRRLLLLKKAALMATELNELTWWHTNIVFHDAPVWPTKKASVENLENSPNTANA